ncbi:precorrin-4 C(11)-methyltransferase [Synechococcus sp. H70.1]|uniref:precorrin-4 C(11)-methyltransferase n=1 Tax=Synechococcus sp. H70.1 TaxID=2964527 RepID=UPI0039C63E03
MREPTSPYWPVYIVGAGPGDPELITLRGQRVLSQADAVFYTGSLLPEGILVHCRPGVEAIDTRSLTLEMLLPQIVERVKAGLRVVRLQDGDPCLYGALHELLLRLAEAGIPFEIVPGVSAFQLAAARLQVELTVPELVQTVILTRASGRTRVPAAEALTSLAAHRASLCLYLSARHVEQAQADLLAHYPADTPVAICYRLGWPDEQIWLGSLGEMAALSRHAGLERTVLYLISPALQGLAGGGSARSRLYSPDHAHLFRPKFRY